MDRSADPSMIHPSIHDPYIDPWMNILIHGSSVYHRRQDYIKNGYILYIILVLSIRTGVHTNCAAHRMHSCCNPLLYDMLYLIASAVSCVELVASQLQAAAAEVAVAKLLLVCLVWLCCIYLVWVFSLSTTVPRYCVGVGTFRQDTYSTTRSRDAIFILSCCPVVTIRMTYGRVAHFFPTTIPQYRGVVVGRRKTVPGEEASTTRQHRKLILFVAVCVSQSE